MGDDERAKTITLQNQDLYDIARNYGERSDILKYELVYKFGGFYVDTDFECLKPIDPLHYAYDFYVGIQPLDTNIAQLGAALFGAWPGHPVLKHTIESIRQNKSPQIIVKTGPVHFTRAFFRSGGRSGTIDMPLPASYLYPMDYRQKGKPRSEWDTPEAFAVHHWEGSWLNPEAFVLQ